MSILEEFSIFASIAIVIIFFKNNASILIENNENEKENEINILDCGEKGENKINQDNSLSEGGNEVKQEMINKELMNILKDYIVHFTNFNLAISDVFTYLPLL